MSISACFTCGRFFSSRNLSGLLSPCRPQHGCVRALQYASLAAVGSFFAFFGFFTADIASAKCGVDLAASFASTAIDRLLATM
eukprot:CAMPEP_0181210312 /NCGR_PEP_ID=MMETSP1096-20121128/23157_1 /TAXON_ID=156174 ORGANISM="Chrysochromulina ericina, Strain CCMP281" /NCGR_SAMPLE_ID=MMETSP1096 /ASSEMBLY_ACC=CAM_ASM_000453 /LENGTH=82 /DNA_ID=CAMNT_0023301581 /DNA_START=956 /DNA_END=1201 /DNA_ORIENTATION=-